MDEAEPGVQHDVGSDDSMSIESEDEHDRPRLYDVPTAMESFWRDNTWYAPGGSPVEEDTGYSLLMLAASAGNLPAVQAFLDMSHTGQPEFQLNYRAHDGNTALLAALSKHKEPVAIYLIEKGADVSIVNGDKDTALNLACRQKLPDAATLILSHKDGPSTAGIPNNRNCTPMMAAARLGLSDIVKQILDTGNSNLHLMDSSGHSALTWAIFASSNDSVRYLIAAGANVNQPNGHATPPILYCAGVGNYEITRMLLEAGADVNVRGFDNSNVVIQACRSGLAGPLRLFIEAGVDLNDRLESGQTALRFALVRCVLGIHECLTILLNAGARVDDELHYAAQLGYGKAAKLFLTHGAVPKEIPTIKRFMQIHDYGITKVSPLAMSLICNNLEITRLFIDSGFFTESDLLTLPNDPQMTSLLKARGNYGSLTIIKRWMRPWPLQALCTQAVSKLVGYDANSRTSNVKLLGLPPTFERLFVYDIPFIHPILKSNMRITPERFKRRR